MTLDSDKFLSELIDDIRNNRMVLPTMPEVAIKVRESIEQDEINSQQIATLVGADAAMSARLIQVANSPLVRGSNKVSDLPMAITRLGHKLVRDLVLSLAVEQLYHAKSATLKRFLRKVWQHSTQVAAICYVFSDRFTSLRPEQAMLAGLIHKIGVLPIIKQFEKNLDLLKQDGLLEQTVQEHHTIIGRAILEVWNFPDVLISAVAEHENLDRNSGAEVDYTDVVQIANLHAHIGTDHPLAHVNWHDIPAFTRLGLTPEESIKALEQAREDVTAIQAIFD